MNRRFRRKLKRVTERITKESLPIAESQGFGLKDILEGVLMMSFAQLALTAIRHGVIKPVHPEDDINGPKLNERQEGRSEVVGEIARPKLS